MSGDIGEALAATPAGIVAVAAATFALLSRRPRILRIPRGAAAAILGVMWLFQLMRFSIL